MIGIVGFSDKLPSVLQNRRTSPNGNQRQNTAKGRASRARAVPAFSLRRPSTFPVGSSASGNGRRQSKPMPGARIAVPRDRLWNSRTSMKSSAGFRSVPRTNRMTSIRPADRLANHDEAGCWYGHKGWGDIRAQSLLDARCGSVGCDLQRVERPFDQVHAAGKRVVPLRQLYLPTEAAV